MPKIIKIMIDGLVMETGKVLMIKSWISSDGNVDGCGCGGVTVMVGQCVGGGRGKARLM